MKIKFDLIKPVAVLILAYFCMGCSDNDPKEPEEPEIPENPEEVKKDVTDFFADYLVGKKEQYGTERVITFEEIAAEQEMAWEAWKSANNNLSEDKLIATAPLDQKNSGSWPIPADLEPDAVTNYYWGTKGDAPEDGYPMFVYLHGSGPKDYEWETGYTLAQRFEDSPSVYFIPQIANTGDYQPWYLRAKQYFLEKLLRQVFVRGEIDPNKIFFFGISEGGYGSQRLASFYADYLAGAGPMAAGEPLKNAPVENCRNIAFSLRTGANDDGPGSFYRATLTRYTKEEFERFQSRNPGSFVHKIELISGAGHSINYNPTTPWLRPHSRNPYPKYVSWENYEMNNRYRDGFYNIYVNQRSNEDQSSRTYYEMKIDGQNITLDISEVFYEPTEIDDYWGIEMKFAKTYRTATKGKVTLYLCEELINLNDDIFLNVNGKEGFAGRVTLDRRHIVNSCAAYFDPARLYPAAIEIDLEKL